MPSIHRADRRAVSPVVAEILLVAIAVVLAAVIYIMAAGLLAGPSRNHPFVTLTGDYPDAKGNMTVTLAGVSLNAPYGSYKFNLLVEGFNGTAKYLGASGTSVSTAVAANTYSVTYTDFGGTGQLATGDTIAIGGNGVALAHNFHFTFYLIWAADGTVVGQRSWQT